MLNEDKTPAGKRLALQAANYIWEHSEQKFSLSEIAGMLYVNSNYLARVFKHETGHTLLWYHNAVRCENAKKLLMETSLSVAEIGTAVGYVSPAHFLISSKNTSVFHPATGGFSQQNHHPLKIRLISVG